MHVTRAPEPALRPFVKTLWYSEARTGHAARERVLPTGAMHLVIRLTDPPLRLYESTDDPVGRTIGTAVIGGARESFYVRDVSEPSTSVGALLHPGACLPLLGCPAEDLAGMHVPLDNLWGTAALRLREQLLALDSPHDRLACFESTLAARLPRVHGVHPAVAHALARFEETFDIGAVVEETGYSHRRLLTLFRATVGLSPKRYCRILRLGRVLEGLEAGRPLSELAYVTGFSDQAHLTREVRELTGVTPATIRRLRPKHLLHLPIERDDDLRASISFKTRAARAPKVEP